MSLWPGGLEKNAKGTIEWAGGLVDWEHEDIKKHGYYYATVDKVSIECYDPPTDARIEGEKSYIFDNVKATNDTVIISDNSTVLKSFEATGTDMDAGEPKSSSTSSPSDSNSPTVPGQHGGGSGNQADSGANSDSDTSASEPTTTGFSQNDQNGNSAPSQGEHVLRGSLFAVLVAVVVLVAM